MDHQLLPTLEDEDDGLEQPCICVEAEAQLAVRPVTFISEWFDPLRPVGSLHRILVADSVFKRAGMDLHAAK